MENTNRPAWVKHIFELLEQAKAKDPDFERFGAENHQYLLSAPAGEAKIQEFEKQYDIRLPEEYRDFLMLAGNGGAGPYYGLYSLEKLSRLLLDRDIYPVRSEPVIYPKMSDEDWDKAADPEDLREDEVCPYAGILPIGTQGCTFMTGLVLAGPYRGQVVYYDEDFCGKPFFVREKGFLAWYERWLREVIVGYRSVSFGVNLDGAPRQLMELYEQAGDTQEKEEIIQSFYKFDALPPMQENYFKQVCAREADLEIRTKLIGMMVHFRAPGIGKELERLWECGAYGEAVLIIPKEGSREMKEAWCERIFEKLPELRRDGFRNACYLFKAIKDSPGVHAGRLRKTLMRSDLDKMDRSTLFYCIGELNGRKEVLDYFLDYLSREEDTFLLIQAIQALTGMKDQRLREIYVRLMDKYRACENAKTDEKGSQLALQGGSSWEAGQIISNLIRRLDYFGLDFQGASKLLKSDRRWEKWKRQNGFGEL